MAHKRRLPSDLDIPAKANRVLNLILLGFVLIVFRVWHLTVIQHDEREENALRPQRKTIIEAPLRGTIRDRFNLPLAINRVQYDAALLYAPLRQIPAVRWELAADGVKVKRYMRREYIKKLSHVFANKLSLDPERVEDLIHAKGALYNQIPFVLKENITEKEYYSLRLLEKDWPGISAQRKPCRYYPMGKVGCDVVGYLGAINRGEYEKIIEEIAALKSYLAEMDLDDSLPFPEAYGSVDEIKFRLKELKAKSYSLTDRVGKAGIEAKYEGELRGYSGKSSYRSNARGNLFEELPGSSKSQSGKRILLTISAELQEYAEHLLIQNERIREVRATSLGSVKRKFYKSSKAPWIKGGGVVVMEPQSGEILALATHPRYDPNDFILSNGTSDANKDKCSNILRWLECESAIAEIWNGERSLQREYYNPKAKRVEEEKEELTWEKYLQILLVKENPILGLLQDLSVAGAIEISNQGNTILEVLDDSDRRICVDICRVAVDEDRFSKKLLAQVGDQKLSDYRRYSMAFFQIQTLVLEMTRELFHTNDFALWRKENEKPFLSDKRKEEKEQKRYAKPYIDLLDRKEKELFAAFWQENRWQLILAFLTGRRTDENDSLCIYVDYFNNWHEEICEGAHTKLTWYGNYVTLCEGLALVEGSLRAQYLQTMRTYVELTRPLLSQYTFLRGKRGFQTEKDLAAAFYPRYGYGYGRSQSYRQSATQGSIFKLIVSYEALMQKYRKLKQDVSVTPLQLNPLVITDTIHTIGKEIYVGYHADGKPIPRLYKGGRIPRSTLRNIGKIDLLRAIETSSNPYFSLLAGDVLESPNDILEAAKLFSYGAKTGIELPGEIPGSLPTDLAKNRTGLYAAAIGQHTLVVTPLQASVALSAIANGGKVLSPKIVKLILGKSFTSHDEEQANPKLDFYRPKAIEKRVLEMPAVVHSMLLEGMHRVVLRSHGEGLPTLSRLYKDYPEAISEYINLRDQFLGKTSTSEAIERIDVEVNRGLYMYNHVWFGGISYACDGDKQTYTAKNLYGIPELVVVVYLRFGGFGKEGAPMAAQIVSKWREIKQRNGVR